MTIIERILAYLAGEEEELPATTTEKERLLAKVAEKIKKGLLPVPAAPVGAADSVDAGKVPTVQDDGTYKLDIIQADDATTET